MNPDPPPAVVAWISRAELEQALAERGTSVHEYRRQLVAWLTEIADLYAERAHWDGQHVADGWLADHLRRCGAPPDEAALITAHVVETYKLRVAPPSRCPRCDAPVTVLWSGPIGPGSRPCRLRCRSSCGWEADIPSGAVGLVEP